MGTTAFPGHDQAVESLVNAYWAEIDAAAIGLAAAAELADPQQPELVDALRREFERAKANAARLAVRVGELDGVIHSFRDVPPPHDLTAEDRAPLADAEAALDAVDERLRAAIARYERVVEDLHADDLTTRNLAGDLLADAHDRTATFDAFRPLPAATAAANGVNSFPASDPPAGWAGSDQLR